MTGVILGAASCGLPVVLDGFSPMPLPWPPAAWPRRRTLILFLHTCRRRKEAQIALDALGLRPYLDMDMRLGEGQRRRAGDAPVGCRQRDVQPDGNAGAEQYCVAR